MDYKGIKISDKIIIVARQVLNTDYPKTPNLIPQGYVVDKGNTKMLETALNWAKRRTFDDSIEDWCERQKTEKIIPGEQFEYTNGQFTITLCESASGSSQGGKLSFWDCLITAEDGKKFIIGINSELLLHLLKSNTLVNGECKNKVWLGRVKGNQVGAFSENMEEFKQAKLDAAARITKKSTNYSAGTIVETLTSKELYLGEMYLYGQPVSHSTSYRQTETYLVFYTKPKKVHAYLPIHDNSSCDEPDSYSTGVRLSTNKASRIISEKTDLVTLSHTKELIDNFIPNIDNLNSNSSVDGYGNSYWYYAYNNIFLGTSCNISRNSLIDNAIKLTKHLTLNYKVTKEEDLPKYCSDRWAEVIKTNYFADFDLEYTQYIKNK